MIIIAKNKGGRPLKYKTKGELQAAVDAYFTACEGGLLTDDDGVVIRNKHGVPIRIDAKPPTVTGLALALGFESRQALLNYQRRKDFEAIVTTAKMQVEEYAESRLYDRDGVRGAEFSLTNNFRWGCDDGKTSAAQEIIGIIKDNIKAINNPVPNRRIEDVEDE